MKRSTAFFLNMAHKVFITATATGAGKTWVTAAAIRSLLRQGIRARALKPVACGMDDAGRNEDIEALLSVQFMASADIINRYRFALPAAPSQAAAVEGQVIDTHALLQWCNEKTDEVDCCLIEGVGGLMTPITETWLVSDWIEAMPDYDVWLVVGCKLGAINQTLLTLDKLKQMERSPAQIFFNAACVDGNDWIESTRQAVEPFLNPACVVSSIRFGEHPDI
jgi:dethiobiotin synthetase